MNKQYFNLNKILQLFFYSFPNDLFKKILSVITFFVDFYKIHDAQCHEIINQTERYKLITTTS